MIYYNISSFILANQSNTGQQNDVVGFDRLFTEVRIGHTSNMYRAAFGGRGVWVHLPPPPLLTKFLPSPAISNMVGKYLLWLNICLKMHQK